MPRRTKRRAPAPILLSIGWASAFIFPFVGLGIAVYLVVRGRRDTGVAMGAVSIIMIGIWERLLGVF